MFSSLLNDDTYGLKRMPIYFKQSSHNCRKVRKFHPITFTVVSNQADFFAVRIRCLCHVNFLNVTCCHNLIILFVRHNFFIIVILIFKFTFRISVSG